MKRDVEKFVTKYKLTLPDSYKVFLETHSSFNSYYWKESEDDEYSTLWNLAEINENNKEQYHLYLDSDFSINKQEPIPFFKAMKYYRQMFEKFLNGKSMTDEDGNHYSFERFESTICIGEEDGDSTYLLLDPKDNYAVYLVYHDAYFVKKIAGSFEEFISSCKTEDE
jgi:hypothetical protein